MNDQIKSTGGTSEGESGITFVHKQFSPDEEYQLPEIETESELDGLDEHTGGYDVLFVQAAHIVVQFQKGSISLIQRKLKIGFNRSGRIVDQLERARIISSTDGSKPREVLIATAEELDKILKVVLKKIKPPLGNDPIKSTVGTSEGERGLTFDHKQGSYVEEYQLSKIETESELDESTEHTGGYDALFVQAAHIVVQFQKGSISLIQRKLKIGFNRSGRIVDQLERARIISSADGNKPREVLIATAEELDKFLANYGLPER